MAQLLNKIFDAAISFLKKRSFFHIFLYLLICAKIIPLFFVAIVSIIKGDIDSAIDMNDISSFYSIFCMTIIIPFIETIIAQHIPIKMLLKNKFIQNNKYIAIIISAFFFGIGHTQSITHIFFGFGVGLVFGIGYITILEKTNSNEAFLMIFGVHSAMNTISTLSLFFL